MEIIIEADKDEIVLEGRGLTVDCNDLRKLNVSTVVYEGSDKWVEKNPFTGQVRDFDFTISDRIIEKAKEKLPKTVYKDTTGEEKIITQGEEIPEGYSEVKSDEVKFKEMKNEKLYEIEREYSQRMKSLIGDYPEEERNGWSKQEEQALKIKNGEESSLISKMASIRELSENEMADRILIKVERYEDVYSELTATLHVLEEQLESAETVEEVEAVNWSEN